MKIKTAKPIVSPKPRNFVAKHSIAINKPQIFKDKKKDYTRHPKHKTGKANIGQTADD